MPSEKEWNKEQMTPQLIVDIHPVCRQSTNPIAIHKFSSIQKKKKTFLNTLTWPTTIFQQTKKTCAKNN